MKALSDTGPLVGCLNRGDQYHAWAVEGWSAQFDPLWTCESVLSEAVFASQSEGLNTEPIFRLLERGIIRLGFAVEDHPAVVAVRRMTRILGSLRPIESLRFTTDSRALVIGFSSRASLLDLDSGHLSESPGDDATNVVGLAVDPRG